MFILGPIQIQKYDGNERSKIYSRYLLGRISRIERPQSIYGSVTLKLGSFHMKCVDFPQRQDTY